MNTVDVTNKISKPTTPATTPITAKQQTNNSLWNNPNLFYFCVSSWYFFTSLHKRGTKWAKIPTKTHNCHEKIVSKIFSNLSLRCFLFCPVQHWKVSYNITYDCRECCPWRQYIRLVLFCDFPPWKSLWARMPWYRGWVTSASMSWLLF